MKKALSIIGLLWIIIGFLFGIVSDFKKEYIDIRPLVFSAFMCFMIGVFIMIKAKNRDE